MFGFLNTRIIIFTFIFQSLNLFAQENDIKWFSEADGLPTKDFDAIEQDNNGNILFGSYLGLTSYDGQKFKTKTIKDGLPSTGISQLKKDFLGRVWLYSYTKKLAYIFNNKIYHIPEFNKNSSFNLFDLYIKSKGEIVVDFYNPYVSETYKLKKNKWYKIQKEKISVEAVTIRNPNNWSEKIAVIDATIETKKEIVLEIDFFKKNKTNYILHYPQKKLKHSRLSIHGKVFFSIDGDLFKFSSNGLVKQKRFNKTIQRIYSGTNNSLWLSFMDGGILQIDQDSFQVKTKLLLKEHNVTNFFQDNENGIWFCAEKGLGYFHHSGYKKNTIDENLLSTVNTHFFLHDTLLIGHINGNIGYIIPGKMEKEKLIYSSPYLNTSNEASVRDFILDGNNILFANKVNGVYVMDRKTFKTKQLYLGGGNFFLKSKEGIFVSLFSEGILKLRRSNSLNYTVEKVKISKRTSKTPNIYYIYEKGENNFLLGCLDGLWELKNSQLKFIGRHPFLKERISCFSKMNDRYLAISTFGAGIILYSKNTTITINTDNGLISDLVNDLYFDKEKRLWVVTANGISIITFFNTNDFRRYKINSISGYECLNYDSYEIAEHKDNMFVASNDGILTIPKDDIHYLNNYNPLNILNVKINGGNLEAQNNSYLYSKETQLEINFRLNQFNLTNQIKYFYRLKNFSEVWYSTNNESVKYNSLLPGEYIFELYAKYPNSNQKSQLKRLHIVVEPQFWQRLSFIVSSTIFSVVLIIFSITYLISKNQKKNNMKLKIAGLQANVIRAQMNPHFMFNAINSIQGHILNNENKLAHFYLGKFSKLLRKIIEVSKNDFVLLSDEIELLENYVELERMRSDNSFKFSVIISENIDKNKILIPSMIIQPFVENSILHGLVALENKEGILSIQFDLFEDNLKCIIFDNGIGRKESFKINMEKQKYHKSVSVSLSEERIDLYNKLYNAKSKIDIEDLYDQTGQASGTKITLFIPILDKHEL